MHRSRGLLLALAAEGKKPKTIKIYTDAASGLQRTQELDDWSEVKKSHIRKHVAFILEGHTPSYANTQRWGVAKETAAHAYRWLADRGYIT